MPDTHAEDKTPATAPSIPITRALSHLPASRLTDVTLFRVTGTDKLIFATQTDNSATAVTYDPDADEFQSTPVSTVTRGLTGKPVAEFDEYDSDDIEVINNLATESLHD
ncbi:hypothetical protein RYH80_18120 [Halobaculum sp. MBLA0147]|uniref:hypothetical protein n=1 Tax=Halobaculum sp. MBLA0147 TaxID=3079934 RepID=UPI0035249A2E